MTAIVPVMSLSFLEPRMVTLATDSQAPVSRLSNPVLPSSARQSGVLHSYYGALFATLGPQHWWPGRTRFEIIVGAILTQNTSWNNVARAIANLRRAKLLSPAAIKRVSAKTLAAHLRPSGYFRQKTKTLKTFVAFLYSKHSGSLERLFAMPAGAARDELLGLRGIGPETADSILLYAGKHPVFVVDAYSRRILERHGLAHAKSTYEELRSRFESALPRDHQLFNEFHALIVHTGKRFCRKSQADCAHCPLEKFLPDPAAAPAARQPDSPR
jgi:endonuclease-3 related protein